MESRLCHNHMWEPSQVRSITKTVQIRQILRLASFSSATYTLHCHLWIQHLLCLLQLAAQQFEPNEVLILLLHPKCLCLLLSLTTVTATKSRPTRGMVM